jgi:fibronectin-binding autotransporter adhesin
MAITVSDGGNPRLVTAESDTVTTDTEFNDNAPNDRSYIRAENIVGAVNAGVTVSGFGLNLQSTPAGGSVAMTNNGAVIVNQLSDALILEGNGGAVTYAGSGIVSNAGAGRALFLDNSDGGDINAVINNDITANTASAVVLNTNDDGVVTFTQAAGTLVSNAFVSDAVIDMFAGGGIVANLNGTIAGGNRGLNATSNGAITVNSSGNIDSAENVLVATGEDSGLVTVNMTGGEVHADFGITANANGNGGVVVNMSGGQVGSAADPVSENGLRGRSAGTAGDVDITTAAVATIFAGTGILADIDNAASTGNINVTHNGTIDLAFFGIFTDNNGTGTTSITNNGSVVANTGIRAFAGATSIVNTGTVTGTGGTAIDLSAANDTLTITRTSLINGNVLAQGGADTLQLGGAGTGSFDLGDIGGGQQYQDFETFNVVSGTWLLIGTTGENWNVLGGTLGGTAAINLLSVLAGGTVAPGASAGTLSAGQVAFAAGATFAVEIGGAAAGQFDQLEVDGRIELGGATLDVAFINGFAPGSGDSFTIIDNDVAFAVVGTFAGLAEGAVFDVAGTSFAVTYAGGDGNDVVLTALNNPPLPALGDVLWRHDNGTVATAVAELVAVSANFAIVGTGDFDRDGDSDILWRHIDGLTVTWELQDGELVTNHNLPQVSVNFAVAGTGDFDGDGDADILWRHTDGLVVTWEMEDGELVTNHNLPQVSVNFVIAGTGDLTATAMPTSCGATPTGRW